MTHWVSSGSVQILLVLALKKINIVGLNFSRVSAPYRIGTVFL